MKKTLKIIREFENYELGYFVPDNSEKRWHIFVYVLLKDDEEIERTYPTAIGAPGLALFEKYTKLEFAGYPLENIKDSGTPCYKRKGKLYKTIFNGLDKADTFEELIIL